jgi:hypothetical protein
MSKERTVSTIELAKNMFAYMITVLPGLWALYQAFSLRSIQRIKLHAEVLRLLETNTREHRLLRRQLRLLIRESYEPVVKRKRRTGILAIFYGIVSVIGLLGMYFVQPGWPRVFYWVGLPINFVAFVAFFYQWLRLSNQIARRSRSKDRHLTGVLPPPEPSSPE